MNELLTLSLVDLCEAIKTRKVSPVDLMKVVLARVGETNPALNSVVAMRETDQLMADAAQAEQRIMQGDARPLEGIPLGVKDLEDVEGMITSMGSLAFRDNLAERDSDQVARLREAGAIVFGKMNTPEFGFTAITKNPLFGASRSPWNLERTPGGSSGGSSAAIAGRVLPLVTGSDGGGSVRIPASFTGTFGLKPSFGRISNGPKTHWSYGDTVCNGPITKTVADAALFMDQVTGPSPYDPNTLPHPGYSYVDKLREPLPTSLRIGYSPDLGYAVVQTDVAAAVEENAKVFESLGHKLEAIKGGPPPLGAEWGRTSSFETAGKIHEVIRDREQDFGRSFLSGVKTAWQMTPEWWGAAAKKREEVNAWCAEIFGKYDLLITPTIPYDPPPAKGPFPEEIDGRRIIQPGVASFTIPFNVSWHPAATVRAGLSNAGLPIGMQIVGPRHRDDLVLQASRDFERERPWHPDWPTEV